MSFERCDDGHRCYNGAVCVENPNDEGAFYCDCDTATEDGAFSGVSCEHEATVYCNDANAVSRISFCTNGGECTENVSNEEAHFGCNCLTNYKGAFCQYTIDQNVENFFDGTVRSSEGYSNNESNVAGAIVITLIVIIALGGIAAFGFFVLRKKLRRFDSWNVTGRQKKPRDASDLALEADGAVLKEAVEAGAGIGYSAGDSSGDDTIEKEKAKTGLTLEADGGVLQDAMESGTAGDGTFTIDDNDTDEANNEDFADNASNTETNTPAVVTPTADDDTSGSNTFADASSPDEPAATTETANNDGSGDATAETGSTTNAEEKEGETTEPEIV